VGERDDGVGEGRRRDEDGGAAHIGWPEADLDLLNGLVRRVALHERHDREEHSQLHRRRRLQVSSLAWRRRAGEGRELTEKGPHSV
jgi:hypothetical protein